MDGLIRSFGFFGNHWIVLTAWLLTLALIVTGTVEKKKAKLEKGSQIEGKITSENAQKHKQIIMSVDLLLLKLREGRGTPCVSHLAQNLNSAAAEQWKPIIESIPKKSHSQWKGDFLLRTTFTLAGKWKKSAQQKTIPDSNPNLAA